MDDQGNTGADSAPGIRRAVRLIALAGGLLSLATAFVVVISVTLRWFGAGTVPGDFELVQMATAITIFCFLPLCQFRRGNIMVDTFTSRWPAALRHAVDAFWDLVYAAMMLLLAISLAQGALDVLRNKSATMVLGLPLWPAIMIASVLTLFLSFVAVVTARALMQRRA